jgi:hypothetical protein
MLLSTTGIKRSAAAISCNRFCINDRRKACGMPQVADTGGSGVVIVGGRGPAIGVKG